MRLTPGDVLSVALVATFAAALVLVAFRQLSRRWSRTSRLRLLCGTRNQAAEPGLNDFERKIAAAAIR